MPDLATLMAQHLHTPFPSSVVKGLDYGGVDAVMIGSDVYGWALKVSRGKALDAGEREKLQSAHDALVRALPSFPEDARPYYDTIVEVALAALS